MTDHYLKCNFKPIKLIGYPQSAITQDIEITFKEFYNLNYEIVTPENFRSIENYLDYQYLIAFSLDMEMRCEIAKFIDENNLDCITYIHNTTLVNKDAKIGKGVFIHAFNHILQGVEIGNHCLISTYCLIGHHTSIGNNCILHPGAMVAGKTKIGNNCTLNFKSGVSNKIEICDSVFLGAFSNFSKSIHQPGMYVGSPAKRIR